MEYFDYGPRLSNFNVEEFLERSQERERQRLENELERLEKRLEQRERIHDEALDELESKLDWYLDRLEMLYRQRRGKKGNRDELKTRIVEFYQKIRNEKRGHWRDREELETERREILRELEELETDNWFNELI